MEPAFQITLGFSHVPDQFPGPVASGGVAALSTREELTEAPIPASVSSIQTSGYLNHGDLGGALYKRVSVEPAHLGKFQSADGSWWEIAEPTVNVRMFGAVGNAAISPINVSTSEAHNDTLAFQAAIDYVAAKGGGYVVVPPGVYACSTLTLRSLVVLFGFGKDISVIRLRDGTNATLIKGENVDALFASPILGGVHAAGLWGISLDGNWFNNTAGSGIEIFGYSNIFRDVFITLFREIGLKSQWHHGGPRGGIETIYDNVYIDSVGATGFWNKGPNDSKLNNVVVLDAGQSANGVFAAMLFEGFAPSRLSNCHVNNRWSGIIQTFTATNDGLAFRHGVALNDKSGGLQISSSHFEGAQYCNALFNGNDTSVDASCFFYAPWNGKNVIIKKPIVFNGKIGGPAAGAARPPSLGIQLGDADNGPNNVNYCIINAMINGCNLGAIDFTHCGTGNHIIARGYADGGPGKVGSATGGNSVNLMIGGAGGVFYLA